LSMVFKLELDGELMLQKVLDDIMYLHEILLKIYQKLSANPQYIHKLELLRHVLFTKQEFISFLDTALQASNSFGKQLFSFSGQFLQCQQIHRDHCDEISALLNSDSDKENEEIDIISSDEYQMLFNDTED